MVSDFTQDHEQTQPQFLPYRSATAGGGAEFLIEDEVSPSFGPPDEHTGDTVAAGDTNHFPDSILFGEDRVAGLRIPADCVTLPEGSDPGLFLPCVAFQDAAFNGSVWVSLQALGEDAGTCRDGVGWAMVDNYSLNKALNGLIAGTYCCPNTRIIRERKPDHVLRPDARVYIHKLGEDVPASTRSTLLAFGVDRIIRPGDTVYLKVNLGGGIDGVVSSYTDPKVVEGVVDLLLEMGASPVICEANMRGHKITEDLLDRRGLLDLIRSRNIRWSNLSEEPRALFIPYDGTMAFSIPLALSGLDPGIKLIDIAQPKHHWECGVTLAQKNLYGAISQRRKAIYHRVYDRIDRVVAAAARAMKPDLALIGGRSVCGELGPHLCVPLRLYYLIVSNDALAADKVGADLLHYPYDAVEYAMINLGGDDLVFEMQPGSAEFDPETLAGIARFAMTPEEVKRWKKSLYLQYFVPHWIQYYLFPHFEFLLTWVNKLFYEPRGNITFPDG